MARSQETFSKKERQKKQLQKKKEKEQRREERRLEPQKSKSLDDMMAYVDENGNITSTPPDPKKMKKVAVEDIIIDTPRETPEDPDAPLTGTVTYFDPSKGYGFITDSRTQERIFVHISAAAESLATGDSVTYTATKGPRGLQAESVQKKQ